MFPITENELTACIPQKAPFLFISSLTEVSDNSCVTTFQFDAKHVLCYNGKLSAAGLLENMAQTSGCKWGYEDYTQGKKGKLIFIGEMSGFTFSRLPYCGEELTTEALIEKVVFNVTIVSAKVKVGEEEIASCRMKIFFEPEPELEEI